MNPADIQRVLDLDKQATEGPWITHGFGPNDQWVRVTQPDGWPDDPVCDVKANVSNQQHDAALIALYRTAAPDLARALLESQAAIAAANVEADRMREYVKGLLAESGRFAAERDALQAQVAALTDERDDLKAQRDAMRADVPVDEQLLGHLAMTGIAKSHDAYKVQKRAEAERDAARAEAEALRTERDTAERLLAEARGEIAGLDRAAAAQVTALATARASVAELVAGVRELRMHAVGYVPESTVARLDALIAKHGGAS